MTSRYAVTIDENGASAPDINTILTNLKEDTQAIFGDDIYLENDSQDGQFLGVLSQAISDCNDAVIAGKNSFSPSGAVGAGLSSQVKLNGIRRNSAGYSTDDVVIVGQAGTQINNGVVGDDNNGQWQLPTTVTIPPSGEITVTVTASSIGAVTALPNSITKILTPTRGWQSVTNPLAATPGAPVELDSALRIRQAQSVALPSRTILAGIEGAVASISNVTRLRYYENDTSEVDGNGLPAHSTALVVDGGDAQAIADAIVVKKTPGSSTVGTTSQATTDIFGNPVTINFYRSTNVSIWVIVRLTAKVGYLSTTGDKIQQAVSDYINALGIGQNVEQNKLNLPALLYNDALNKTYSVDEILIGTAASPTEADDVPIAFNEAAACTLDNVTISVST